MVHGDLANPEDVDAAFAREPQRVVHLAALPGARHSFEEPRAYVDANVTATLNVLEACRRAGPTNLVYASSSSVYGDSAALPFSEHDPADRPISPYGATKRATELLAHAYSHAFGLPVTGLRFFSVYGPWGRPDMAMFLFTDAIFHGRAIDVFDDGRARRDFTYVDDVVAAVLAALDRPAPCRVYNVGNRSPVAVVDLIGILEREIGRPAVVNLLPAQRGDVPATVADVGAIHRDLGWQPATPIELGVARFVSWYRDFFGGEGRPRTQ
jgi:UDP-glucuronate 4-epimerase